MAIYKLDGSSQLINYLKRYSYSKAGIIVEYANQAAMDTAFDSVVDADMLTFSGSKADIRHRDNIDQDCEDKFQESWSWCTPEKARLNTGGAVVHPPQPLALATP